MCLCMFAVLWCDVIFIFLVIFSLVRYCVWGENSLLLLVLMAIRYFYVSSFYFLNISSITLTLFLLFIIFKHAYFALIHNELLTSYYFTFSSHQYIVEFTTLNKWWWFFIVKMSIVIKIVFTTLLLYPKSVIFL